MESRIVQYPALIEPPRAPAQLPRVLAGGVLDLPFGAHSQVCVSSGKVAAFLAYVAYDRKNEVATYALRILNDSAYDVRGDLSCIFKDGSRRAASPLTFKVPPFSMRDDHVPVRLDITGRFERALLEVRSEETYFSVEAASPQLQAPKWTRWSWVPLVPLVLAATTGVMAPRIAPLNAPERVFAGGVMSVPYEASGYGSVEYSLSDRNHVELSGGMAASASGVLHFSLPAQTASSPYTLRVRMRSPFASAEQSATISTVAVAEKKRNGMKMPDMRPLIDELHLAGSGVRAGRPLIVSYATHATTGDISLVDGFGVTWARAPFSPAGRSTLDVPASAAGRTMRVVLHVLRDKQQAQSSVEAIVLASGEAHPPERAATSVPAAPAGAPSIDLSSTVVAAGDTITVRVHGMHDSVRIKLVDGAGGTVAEGDGSSGALAIAAPMVQTPSKFYVVATYTQGVSEQSTIKLLTVTPR